MARQRKRRIRTAHPGVKLKRMKRTTGETWVARFTDPDTRREKQESLTALGKTDEDSRRAWAIQKSETLRARAAALAAGVAERTETPVAAAIADYYKSQAAELAPATVLSYKQATDPFGAWCATHGVLLTETLTPPLLTKYRLWFVARPAHAPVSGAKVGRGAYREGKRKRSAAQINKCVRTLRIVLNHWRKLGTTPALTSDGIRDALEFAKSQRPLPHFLKAKEAQALLEAAMRHDADTFTFVRREKRGRVNPNWRTTTNPLPRLSPWACWPECALQNSQTCAGATWTWKPAKSRWTLTAPKPATPDASPWPKRPHWPRCWPQ